MNQGEQQYAEEARRRIVPLMSLRVMFEDPDVRRLARAAGRGDIKSIDRLVSEGVDVNARGTCGATPLFWAMRNEDGFRRLLELGADPNVVYNDESRTAIMHELVALPDEDFLRLALEYGGSLNVRATGSDEPPIFQAVMSYGKDKLPLLIEFDVDLNARGFWGYTPLLSASLARQYDVVYFLLESGADYTLENNYGVGLVELIGNDRRLMPKDTEQWEWMLRVSSWLRSHGVSVPE